MVERSGGDLDQTFAALADPTRRAILARLREGPATVGEVAAPFEMSLYGVSKHVRVLERAGLLQRDVRGREHHLHLRPAPLESAAAWTERYREFWEARLDALARHVEARQLAEPAAAKGATPGKPGARKSKRTQGDGTARKR